MTNLVNYRKRTAGNHQIFRKGAPQAPMLYDPVQERLDAERKTLK